MLYGPAAYVTLRHYDLPPEFRHNFAGSEIERALVRVNLATRIAFRISHTSNKATARMALLFIGGPS